MVLKIRFGIGEWIAVVAFVGALAATVAAMALPFAYPDIPKETWRLILWPSVTILVLSAIYLTIDIFAFLFRGPKGKIATLRCSFDSTDIGGCVCPNTILRRPDRITGLRPSNASSSPTAHNLVITPNLENQGTVGPTFRTFTLDDDVNRERVTYYRIKVSAEKWHRFIVQGQARFLQTRLSEANCRIGRFTFRTGKKQRRPKQDDSCRSFRASRFSFHFR